MAETDTASSTANPDRSKASPPADHPWRSSISGKSTTPPEGTTNNVHIVDDADGPDILSANDLIDELLASNSVLALRLAEAVEDTVDWWLETAQNEIRRTVPKAIEYGSTDLIDVGRDLAKCMHREVTDEEAAELGIFFYLRGKISRWVDAVARGARPSDDTLFDIGVYVRMAMRVRAVGGWPTGNKTETVVGLPGDPRA